MNQTGQGLEIIHGAGQGGRTAGCESTYLATHNCFRPNDSGRGSSRYVKEVKLSVWPRLRHRAAYASQAQGSRSPGHSVVCQGTHDLTDSTEFTRLIPPLEAPPRHQNAKGKSLNLELTLQTQTMWNLKQKMHPLGTVPCTTKVSQGKLNS